jgi:N-acetylmuramic acid 6-phosphate (MurNAc-6-P) etherase
MHERMERMVERITNMERSLQQSIIEEINSDIKRAIVDAATEVLGLHRRRRQGTMLLKDPELAQARRERRKQ